MKWQNVTAVVTRDAAFRIFAVNDSTSYWTPILWFVSIVSENIVCFAIYSHTKLREHFKKIGVVEIFSRTKNCHERKFQERQVACAGVAMALIGTAAWSGHWFGSTMNESALRRRWDAVSP